MRKNIIKLKQDQTTVKILNSLLSGTIAVIFFACPLFFTGLTAQEAGFEKMMLFYFLVLFGLLIWATRGIATGELIFKKTPLDWPIVAMLVIFTTSTILSVGHKDSLIGSYGNSAKSLIALIAFIIFYYLVVNNINIQKIKLFFWSFFISSALIIIYSLLQLLGVFILPFTFTKFTHFNPLESISALGAFAAAILPLIAVGILQIKRIHPALKNKVILIFIKTLLGLVILATLTILIALKNFIFLPAAIVGIVIILMFLLAKIIKMPRSSLTIPIIIFLTLIILLVLGNFNIINIDLPSEVSLSRSASWNIAKASLADNPLFGSGPSTFYYNFSKFKDVNFNNSPLWNTRFNSAGGGLFELAANVGLLGGLVITITVLVALLICLISLTKTDKKEIQLVLLSLFSSFIVILILAILSPINSSFILLSVLIAVLAVSSAIAVYPEKFKLINLSLQISPKYAIVLSSAFLTISAGAVILFILGAKIYLADIYAQKSFSAENAIEKINILEKAISLSPYQDIYYISLANNYIGLANQEAGRQGNYAGYLNLAIQKANKAVEISPNKASVNEAAALIYENSSLYASGGLSWAENYYNKIIKLDPNNPSSYLRIALINMARANQTNNPDEQKDLIKQAIQKYDLAVQKKPDLAEAYYGQSIAYEKLGDNNKAIGQLEKAVVINRDNINYRFDLGRLYFNRGVARPNLEKNDNKNIIKEITIEDKQDGQIKTSLSGDAEEESLSIEPSQTFTKEISARNNDLNLAEQIFLSILQAMPNHANARYSLAILYQRIGEKNRVKPLAESLLEILADEASKEEIKKQFDL